MYRYRYTVPVLYTSLMESKQPYLCQKYLWIINLVVNYEEGAEYSLLDGDSTNDAYGEYSYEVGPTVRDLSTETHMEFGSRVGGWRLARLLDDYGIPATIDVCAHALERNPESHPG